MRLNDRPLNRILILCVVTVILFTVATSSAFGARTVDEINKDISDTSRQRQDLESQKNSLVQQLADNENRIRQLDSDIVILQDQLTVVEKSKAEAEAALFIKQAELTEAENKLESQNAVIEKRLQLIYKHGDLGYLDVVLDATDFNDFLSRFNYLMIIVKADKKLLSDIKKIKDQVEAQRDVLETKREEVLAREKAIEDIKRPLDQKKQEIVEDKLLKESLYADTRTNQQATDEMLAILLTEQQEAYNRAKGRGGGTAPSPKGFMWPVYGPTTCPWGYHDCNVHVNRPHHGLDIAADEGSTVVAPAGGTVEGAYWNDAVGNVVEIYHGGGVTTRYCHLSEIWCSVGQVVVQGTPIGTVGNTGYLSQGAHLHFEVYDPTDPRNIDGTVDPLWWLP